MGEMYTFIENRGGKCHIFSKIGGKCIHFAKIGEVKKFRF